jgi:hypothetical protein
VETVAATAAVDRALVAAMAEADPPSAASVVVPVAEARRTC